MKPQTINFQANFLEKFEKWMADAKLDENMSFFDNFANDFLINKNFRSVEDKVRELTFPLLERIFKEILSQKKAFDSVVFSFLRIFFLHENFPTKKRYILPNDLKININFPSAEEFRDFFSLRFEEFDENNFRKIFVEDLLCKCIAVNGSAPPKFLLAYLEKFPQGKRNSQRVVVDGIKEPLRLSDNAFALSEVEVKDERINIFIWLSDKFKSTIDPNDCDYLAEVLGALRKIYRENYSSGKKLNLNDVLDFEDGDQKTPAMKVAELGKCKLLEAMLDSGVRIDHKENVFQLCLGVAYQKKDFSLAIKLIERNVELPLYFEEDEKKVLLDDSKKFKNGKAFRRLIIRVTDFDLDYFYSFICDILKPCNVTNIPKNKIYILLLMASRKDDFEKTYQVCEKIINGEKVDREDKNYILSLVEKVSYVKSRCRSLEQDGSNSLNEIIENLRELLPSSSQEQDMGNNLFGGKNLRQASPPTARKGLAPVRLSQTSSADFPATKKPSTGIVPGIFQSFSSSSISWGSLKKRGENSSALEIGVGGEACKVRRKKVESESSTKSLSP